QEDQQMLALMVGDRVGLMHPRRQKQQADQAPGQDQGRQDSRPGGEQSPGGGTATRSERQGRQASSAPGVQGFGGRGDQECEARGQFRDHYHGVYLRPNIARPYVPKMERAATQYGGKLSIVSGL